MNYPDWVEKYKKEGTSVKKIGENYYLYKVTSERVAGKKYPVSRQTYIGKVTEAGVESSGVKIIPDQTEGTILAGVVPEVCEELREIVLIKVNGFWMYTKISQDQKDELKRYGLYEYGFLPKETSK